ncbi:MAG: heat-inducible transcriptional repressor HrcA [Gammaproteobacteria bacterium]|nr:heat-inducible transcriptional repressor HrcA [Gammaproteobacteria bacterium]
MNVTKSQLFDERAGQLMKVLVETYISEGLPVGSKALLEYSGLKVSSATVRNVLADLEKMGLIHSPHTSAGRVPTVQGYRLFVDSLLSVRVPDKRLLEQLAAHIKDSDEQSLTLENVSETLSDITKMAGLVVLPKKELIALTQIEFIPLSNHRMLAVLVQSDNEVQNRVLHLKREYSNAQLQQMSNYLNTLLIGKSIKEVCQTLFLEMENTRQQMDGMMRSAIQMATHAFAEHHEAQNDYMISGETNLMQYNDIADMDRMRQLFEAFHEKQHILTLLNQVSDADGVQLFIGDESGYEPLGDCSVVAAPYQIEGQTMGVLGVIGPTRMAYGKVIPIVDLTAKLLTSALNHEN